MIHTNVNIEGLDKLTIGKIHKITSTKESTINFLQGLKLLPITPKSDGNYGQVNSHDWYLAELEHITDGKQEYINRFDNQLFYI